MSQWYVYILECSDGSLYTGITTDVERRVDEHNYGNRAAKYTRARRPVRLVYQGKFNNRSEATVEEHRIKALTKTEKQSLINDHMNMLDC